MVSSPLKNISQLGWLFPIYGKIKNVPNHQSDIYIYIILYIYIYIIYIYILYIIYIFIILYIYIYVHIFTYIPHSIPCSPRSSPAIQPEIIAAPCSTVHPRCLARRKRLEPAAFQGHIGWQKRVCPNMICGNLWKSMEIPWKSGTWWEILWFLQFYRRFYMILATKIWGGSCNSYN